MMPLRYLQMAEYDHDFRSLFLVFLQEHHELSVPIAPIAVYALFHVSSNIHLVSYLFHWLEFVDGS